MQDGVDVSGWGEAVLPDLRAFEDRLLEEFIILKLFYLPTEFLHNHRGDLRCGGRDKVRCVSK